MLSVGEFHRPHRPPPDEGNKEEELPRLKFRDTSYIPPAPPKRRRRFLLGFIIALAGLAVMVGSMFLPWYSYTISGKALIGNIDYDVYDEYDHSFNGIRALDEKSVPGFILTKDSSQSWAEYEKAYKDRHRDQPELPGVYSATLMILVAAVTACALGAFLGVLFRMRKRPLLFPVIVLAAGALIALVGAGAFSSWHVPAMGHDKSELPRPDYPVSPPSGPYASFSDKATRDRLTYEWGPDIGWYLSLAGPALVLGGAALLFLMNRGRED